MDPGNGEWLENIINTKEDKADKPGCKMRWGGSECNEYAEKFIDNDTFGIRVVEDFLSRTGDKKAENEKSSQRPKID